MAGFREADGIVIAAHVAGADGAFQAAGSLLVTAGQQGGPCGAAFRAVGIVLGEADTIPGEAVNVWGSGHGVTVAAEIPVAEVIGEDEDDVLGTKWN